MSQELFRAKISLVHYLDVINSLREVSYLKQDGNEGYTAKLERVVKELETLQGDSIGRAFVNKIFNLSFDFEGIQDMANQLKKGDIKQYHPIRKRLREMEEVLIEKEGITKH